MTQHEYRVILETNYLNRKPTRVEFLLQGRTIDFKETQSWKVYREITNYFPKNIQTLIDKTTLQTSSEGLDFVLNIEPNTLTIHFPITNPSDSLPELVLQLKENKQKPQFIVDQTIMEQIRIYDTHTQYETEQSTLIKPNVSFCIDQDHIHFIPKPYDYSQDYLTFEALSDNTHLYFKSTRGGESRTISASSNNGKTWNEYTSSASANGTLIATLMKGQKVMIKGDIYSPYTGRGYSRFNGLEGDGSLILYGNIMSLAYGDNFIGKTSMKKTVQEPIYEYDETTGTDIIVGYEDVEVNICFGWIFETILNLVSAENLILPADELYMFGDYGTYEGMFHNCTCLVKAPSILPATKLTSSCYYRMFDGCFSLQNTPELPATTLASGCYESMFEGCTSLTTAPELPATTLAEYCYSSMFSGCTNLSYIKAMFTTTPNNSYTQNWVLNVPSTGTFVKNNAATWDVTGTNGIPTGWTVETTSA